MLLLIQQNIRQYYSKRMLFACHPNYKKHFGIFYCLRRLGIRQEQYNYRSPIPCHDKHALINATPNRAGLTFAFQESVACYKFLYPLPGRLGNHLKQPQLLIYDTPLLRLEPVYTL